MRKVKKTRNLRLNDKMIKMKQKIVKHFPARMKYLF